MIYETVRLFNHDVKSGVAVLFDKTNEVYGLPSMIGTGSLITES